jgi:hypothetical protein
MILFKKITAVLFIIFIIISLAAMMGGCRKRKVVKVDLQNDIFCLTDSMTVTAPNSSLTSVTIPPNSAITKIRASVRSTNANLDFGAILVTKIVGGVGERIFETEFPKDPNVSVGIYETDFLHPLYVGPEGGNIFVATGLAIPADMQLSVVYCPNSTEE